ncbi:unnamed protein product [Aphanomyces euteiches]
MVVYPTRYTRTTTMATIAFETIRASGNNNYKIPHMRKKKLAREGMLPETIEVDEAVVEAGLEQLKDMDLESMMKRLQYEVVESLCMADICTELENLQLTSEVDGMEDMESILGLQFD